MSAGLSPSGGAHKLVNRTNEKVVYLDVGTRISDDEVTYPADDLEAVMGENGKWRFQHKDGTAY